jgi:hypothetical protein
VIAIVLAGLAVIVAAVGIVRSRGGDDELDLDLGVPTEASVSELEAYSSDTQPVYWVGPPSAGRLELTRTSRPAIYVRYLPETAELGSTARYTTIATYPLAGAYASIQRSTRSRGFRQKRLAAGGLAVWRPNPGTSIYVAYPRKDYLVEVYDPNPARGRALAFKRLSRVP